MFDSKDEEARQRETNVVLVLSQAADAVTTTRRLKSA